MVEEILFDFDGTIEIDVVKVFEVEVGFLFEGLILDGGAFFFLFGLIFLFEFVFGAFCHQYRRQ